MPQVTNLWCRLAAIASLGLLGACVSQQTMPGGATPTSMPESLPADPINVDHVIFATNSYIIDASAQETINDVAKSLHGESDRHVTIVGRADSSGTPAINAVLSQKRAQAVRQALIATGKIEPAQIDTAWTDEQPQNGTAGLMAPPGEKVVDLYVQ